MSVTPAETRATLGQRSAVARQEAEVRAAAVRRQVVALVAARLPPSVRAWLIGSLAWGGFGQRSDIDLVFDGLDDARMTEVELALCQGLGLPVDVLRLEDLPVTFRQRVEAEGLPLHGPG